MTGARARIYVFRLMAGQPDDAVLRGWTWESPPACFSLALPEATIYVGDFSRPRASEPLQRDRSWTTLSISRPPGRRCCFWRSPAWSRPVLRLRISPVLGYLLAGVALGPYGLGAIAGDARWLTRSRSQCRGDRPIAAFGVVALLFTMGLELSFERLRRMRRLVFGLGLAQVVGATLWFWRPSPGVSAVAAVGAGDRRGLVDVLDRNRHSVARREQAAHGAGRPRSFAVLLFQDLAVAPLLVMTGALSAAAGGGLLGAPDDACARGAGACRP